MKVELVCCCLAVALGVLAAHGERVAVMPGTLVEVSFDAAVEKGLVVEDDPTLAELLPISFGRPGKTGAKFAAAEWNFLDAQERKLKHTRISMDRVTLFSRQMRHFAFRVYVPEKAQALEVVPVEGMKGDRVKIEKLAAKVTTVATCYASDAAHRWIRPSPPVFGEVLNQNADFSADDLSLPGWQLSGAARFGKDREGRACAILEDGGIFGDPFPVTGGRTLVVTLTAEPPRFATRKHIPWGAIHFYDSYEQSAGKEQPFARPKLTVHTSTRGEQTETYQIPPSAKWCRIAVRVGTIYSCTAKEGK